MGIEFACSACGRRLSVPEQYAGHPGTCPGCGASLTVPQSTAAALPVGVLPSAGESGRQAEAARPEPPHGAAGQPSGDTSQSQEVGRPAYGAVPVTGAQTHPLAIVSLVLGIASFVVCWFFPAVAGLICGIVARNRIRESPEVHLGDGLALAGIILSAINIGLSLVGGIVYAIFVAAMVASHP